MNPLVDRIVSTNQSLTQKVHQGISFNIDHEGKRLLNEQVSRFYKRTKISKDDFINIAITAFVVIEKMKSLRKCGWKISELNEQVQNGIDYYESRFEINFEKLFLDEIDTNDRFQNDLREKFPAKFKTLDGHYVRSKAELLIDNFLYINGIVHAYEKKLPIKEIVYCDFYIPPGKDRPQPVYLEYWGIENDKVYLDRKSTKITLYKKYNFSLIQITEKEVAFLEEYLTTELLSFQIPIGH